MNWHGLQVILIQDNTVFFCNGSLSTLIEYILGVPQGSNPGPLLFILFSNDLPICLQRSLCNFLANDTITYQSGNDLCEVDMTLQHNVNSLIKWFESNKLTLNVDK